VLVCVDGGVDGAREFAAAHGIEKCVVAAVVDEDAPSDLYSVRGLPHQTLIGCDGVLVKNYHVELPSDLDACFPAEADVLPASALATGACASLSTISKKYSDLEKSDFLLMENPHRWVMFPIQYPEVWEMYKTRGLFLDCRGDRPLTRHKRLGQSVWF
jgi:hypothetical protein